MITAAPQRSTDAEYEAFGAICERLAGFERTLSPFHVDGWLTAMACGPVRLPSAQWLELMCGDAFDRAFADPPDRAQALAALQARLVVLHSALDAEALLDRPDEIRIDPYFDDWTKEDEDAHESAGGTEAAAAAPRPELPPQVAPELVPEEAEHMAGALWADGFLIGLEALTDAWRLPQNDEGVEAAMQELSAQFEALLHDHDSEELRKFLTDYHEGKALDRDALLLNACFAVQDLRLFLLDHGPKPETRRVEAQPGRNDPCPCGSGKKFKKCHGALA